MTIPALLRSRAEASAQGGGWAAAAKRQNDLLLAGLLVAIVALFMLPLPTPLIDFLIASNLCISLTLLIVSMYVPGALSLSTFPSLLLFTTLFRLSLNIASTKLILLEAHAGHIIDTFGKLIVGNNIVVGGVVFLIIAIVQFIVIAKGSERVAEVAARFALDAMPGKQMSIDAEVRAGTLSTAQAQARRRELEHECQMHGAMDGAMKFVKGDAIAAIVIALVNILAGVAIGTLMHGMSAGDALQRYAILTVGDGMVSQIPSLLVSVAAGVVITRVTSGGNGSQQLASQILGQLAAHPRALVVAAATASGFLLVPGFPKWAFGVWVAVVGAAGHLLLRQRRQGRTPAWISRDAGGAEAGVDESSEDAVAYPVALRLSSALRGRLDMARFDRAMVLARNQAERELGPVFPRLQVGFADLPGPPDGYEVLVQDVVMARGALKPGHFLLDPESGPGLPAHAVAAEPFGPFGRVAWVDAVPPGTAALGNEEVLVAHVEQVARRHLPRLIGLQEVQQLVHWMQRQAPELAAEVSRVVPAQRLAETLRRLLQEGIPVRNLKAIFESLVRWCPQEPDPIGLAELVRVDLGAYITSRHAAPDRTMSAVLFDNALAEAVQRSIERTPRGNLLLLNPAVKESVLQQLRQLLAKAPAGVVVVVGTDVRRYVKTMIEPAEPRTDVLAYQEIDEDVTLLPVGWVTLPQDAAAPAETAPGDPA